MLATQHVDKQPQRVELVDPHESDAIPPFKQQKAIEMPGLNRQMNPTPDHGEESYVGSVKLQRLKALITGGDSGIGRAIAI